MAVQHPTSYAQASRLYLRTKIGQNGKCVIADNYFSPPFKLMPPFYEKGNMAEIILIAVSPGMLKGDAQEIQMDIGENCRLELSSQSFEKIQDTEDGYASRNTQIHIHQNALLDFSPLPIIPFANAHFKNHSHIVLHPNAQLLYSEIITAGRIAMGEAFAFHKIHSTLKISTQEGESLRSVFLDNTILEPTSMDLRNPCMFGNYTHYLNGIFLTRLLKLEDLLELLESAQINAGVSLLPTRLPEGYHSLCLKALANGSEPLLALRKRISLLLLERMES
ncbi:urease accessory protein UreD [Helicobacter mehlei]|uniref:Urease accessory protein UreD n=1 Tax=Helicobacter mehlei TaxID=2316080 RepID=A0A553UKZ1_9HELI|nr:urease accessory protein UreD [Helicobacter mehlei]TSA80865.1 urease accessory protein UreD [Helicobacter mehlei]